MSRESLFGEEAGLGIGEKFKSFVENFRDEQGRLKYLDEVRRMINYEEASITVEFKDLYRYDPLQAELLLEKPREFLREASEALKEVVALESPEYARDRVFTPRFIGLFDTVRIRDIGSEHIGRLVQVNGIVTRMHPRATRMVKAVFRHDKCGGEFPWPQGDDEELGERIERPSICPRCGEGGGRFTLVREKSVYIDWQKIVIQERPEDVPGGQIPRSIEVHLQRDLVERVRPGDRIKVVGVVGLQQFSSTSTLYSLYMEANSILLEEKILEEVSITREDEEKILQLARDPWIKDKIVASIAPTIYGHWDLKEAIALLLFSGVAKLRPDGTRTRGDIHVLFVGDPGVAKSQLLQSASQIAPRVVYTTGKGSTAAGLTAAVLRDARTGEYFLEAGALVLADGGVAVIDEFDKMSKDDRGVIHEAMEQQTVSIAKAGIKATLSARASILAAGNPKFGYYDPSRSFVDNIDLPAPIISRFDLIFIVRDVIEKSRDEMLANYVLETHTNVELFRPEIDLELLRKYIAYARKHVKPKLTPQAKRLLKEFYVEMRSSALQHSQEGAKPIPITTRQLEALIRLTEAHARMSLKHEATEEDAIAAIRIMTSVLESIGLDIETGAIDVGIIMTGASFRARKIMSEVLDAVKRIMDEKGGEGCVRAGELIKILSEKNVPEEKVREAIEKLYRQGLIIEVRTECYKAI
ncbi:MAG: minichromosome maintenance protein MCM [Aeropyrum sp.]|nr:minichromosome maintenance protein MCM [Aeropyrum sp.]MCE4615993.1 minichromosome maintenance protein MCM [Aeropyrum sp.]